MTNTQLALPAPQAPVLLLDVEPMYPEWGYGPDLCAVIAVQAQPERGIIDLCDFSQKDQVKRKYEVYDVDLKPKLVSNRSIRASLRKLLSPEGTRKDAFMIFLDTGSLSRKTIWFNKGCIAIQRNQYLRHQDTGGVYVSKRDSSRMVIYFTPELRLVSYRNGVVMNLSYNQQYLDIPKYLNKYIHMYLKHFGIPGRTIQEAIIPTMGKKRSKQFPPGDKLKKSWRKPTLKGVLQAAGLPSGKTIQKALAEDIVAKDYDVVCLTTLGFIWYISNSPDMVRAAIEANIASICDYYSKNQHYKRAMAKLLKPFNKREKASFTNDIITALTVKRGCGWTSGNTLVRDVISMAKDVYKAGALGTVSGRSLQAVHDELSIAHELIKNPDLDNPVQYADKIKVLDGLSVGKGLRISLPHKGIDVKIAGKKLHNCLSGYASRHQNREITIILLRKGDELYGAGEILNNKLQQISAFANAKLPEDEFNAVYDVLLEKGIVSTKAVKPWNYK